MITKTGADVTTDLDADPLALLPSGAVGMLVVDAKVLHASDLGQRVERLLSQRVPVPPSANFEPKRDLERLYIGFYSMTGVDVAAAAVGSFDPAAIEAAADGVTVTPTGAPLVKQTYSGHTLYVSNNLGFVVLSRRTALFGNETGMRRVLDRIADGRVKREVPSWMGDLLGSSAPVIGGANLVEQDVVSAVSDQFPFLKGMQSVRVLGNFEPPGMHLAGTSVYAEEEQATNGASSLLALHEVWASMSWLTSLFGLSNPVKKLEAQAEGKESKFVAAVDSEALGGLFDQLSNFLGVPPQPKVIDATLTPGVKDEGP